MVRVSRGLWSGVWRELIEYHRLKPHQAIQDVLRQTMTGLQSQVAVLSSSSDHGHDKPSSDSQVNVARTQQLLDHLCRQLGVSRVTVDHIRLAMSLLHSAPSGSSGSGNVDANPIMSPQQLPYLGVGGIVQVKAVQPPQWEPLSQMEKRLHRRLHQLAALHADMSVSVSASVSLSGTEAKGYVDDRLPVNWHASMLPTVHQLLALYDTYRDEEQV